jgi:tellurium resistance protein TerD
MAATNLEAGANVSLTAINPLLKNIVVGFGWNLIPSNGPMEELVPSAIMCDANGKAVSDEHFVFFNQLGTPDGSVTYVTGEDKEQIEVDLSLIPDAVEKIVFVVYIDPDIRKPGNFGAVREAYIQITDRENNGIVRYEVTQPNMDVNALIFGELYRYKGQWKFRAVGQGYSTGIVGVAKDFGVTV